MAWTLPTSFAKLWVLPQSQVNHISLFACYYFFLLLWLLFHFPSLTHSLRLQHVPDVAGEVIIASQEKTSREWGCEGGDTAHEARVLVSGQLLITTEIVQSARRVVWASDHCITIGEELWRKEERLVEMCLKLKTIKIVFVCAHTCLRMRETHPNSIYVTLVAIEGLFAPAFSYVPHFGCVVTWSWNKKVKIWRHSQWHAVTNVASKNGLLCPSLDVPETAKEKWKMIINFLSIDLYIVAKMIVNVNILL